MRVVTLGVLLLTASAAAQTPDPVPARPGDRLTRGQRTLVVVAGVASLFLVAPDDDLGVATFAAPAAAGLVVYVTGRAFGRRGQLSTTLAGSAVGALPAHILYAIGRGAPDDGFWWYLAGSAVHLIGPPVGALVGFEKSLGAAPVVLVGPDGTRVAGLALHLSL